MEKLLHDYDFLDIEFIKAVDGRSLSKSEREAMFDDVLCMRMYGRNLNPGEVGCTLSHRKVCTSLLESNSPYAVIFEDDISIIRDLNIINDPKIDKILCSDSPVALMLSGDLWYWNRRPISNVYDCVGSYAYLLNRAGADCILNCKPANVADHWLYYKKHGLKIKAMLPYIIDANMEMDLLGSDVNQDCWRINRSALPFKTILSLYKSGIIKRLLKSLGHFESKVRITDGKIVNNP